MPKYEKIPEQGKRKKVGTILTNEGSLKVVPVVRLGTKLNSGKAGK